jgi:HSP20 family protein
MAIGNLIPRLRARSPLVRHEGSNPLVNFHQEMNRLFDDFWRDFDGGSEGGVQSFGFPHMEVSDGEKEVKIQAELPGMDEKDIDLVIKDGVLTLRGEKKSEAQDQDRRVTERFYGTFERRIALPPGVDEDKANASFKKGVLCVTLPKSAESQEKVKRIPISAN